MAKDANTEAPRGRLAKIYASQAVQALKKDHGNLILVQASDARVAKTALIPSGVFHLDRALGGGWGQGKINTIYGMKSCGKTTLVLKALGNAQQMCANCWRFPDWYDDDVLVQPIRWRNHDNGKDFEELVLGTDDQGEKFWYPSRKIRPQCCGKFREAVCAFIDVEGTIDKAWAARQGVDLDRLLLSQPEYAEQALDLLDSLLRSGEVDVLALDSLAFLETQKEIEESTAKETMGLQARRVGVGTRKLVSGQNAVALRTERRPTVFFTNQIRMKMTMFGNPETVPAGLAPQFAAAIEVKVKKGKTYFDKKDADDNGEPIPLYADYEFDVEKNKTAAAKLGGTYQMLTTDQEAGKAGDVVDAREVFVEANRRGILKKNTSKWECAGVSYQTKGEIEALYTSDIRFRRAIRAVCAASLQTTDLAARTVETPPASPAPESTALVPSGSSPDDLAVEKKKKKKVSD